MENFIGNIFFFGSLKDGFKVYPDLGAVSNVYESYYTNTEADWLLVAKKSSNITTYTYVKYELLTSVVNGRTGSCLGISIDFIDCYFSDLEILRTQVIEKIWEAFLAENVLLEPQGASGKVAFKPYNLNEVSQYLDTKAQTIRKVIAENHFDNVGTSGHIPDSGGNPIYGLHPKSSLKAISEIFETYGVVKLSPRSPIETKSVSQKAEDQIKALQRKIETLNIHLSQKNDEIEDLKRERDELKKKLTPRLRPEDRGGEQSTESGEKTIVYTVKNEPWKTAQNHFGKAPSWANPRVLLAVLVCILISMLIFMLKGLFLSSDPDEKAAIKNINANRSTKQTGPQPGSGDIPSIRESDGRGFLIAEVFLQKNRGRFVANKEGFKDLFASYLLDSNARIRQLYDNDKDRLWDKIVELNPHRDKDISNFLEINPGFYIESNNQFQRKLLEDLVIYSE